MSAKQSTAKDDQTDGFEPSIRERVATVDPVILAAGAAIAGAAAGAFIPRSDTETRLLAPMGAHVTAAAGAAGASLRQALAAQLAAVPVVGQIAADQVDRVIDAVVEQAGMDGRAEDGPISSTGDDAGSAAASSV